MLTVARNLHVEIEGSTFVFKPLSALEAMRIAAGITQDPVTNTAYITQILCEKLVGLKSLVDENGKPHDISTMEAKEEFFALVNTPLLFEIWDMYQEASHPSEDEKKS